MYGTLFAAMINGAGTIITDKDEEGNDLPFLTTEQILEQIAKFGFYVTYDVKSNLPSRTITLLQSMYEIGYDKITKIMLKKTIGNGGYTWQPCIIVMKSEQNTDLLSFGCKVSKDLFDTKLEANSIRNITDEKGIKWDWLTYIANISDILDEQLDNINEFKSEGKAPWQTPADEPYTGDVVPSVVDYQDTEPSVPGGFTPYVDPETDEEGDSDGTE